MPSVNALCPNCKIRCKVALIKEDAPNAKCHVRGQRCLHITGAKCLTCGKLFGLESPFDLEAMTDV